MVATQRLLVSPRILGEDEPNLTSIFFRWVETTNQISLGLHNPIYPSPYHHALYLHHHHIIIISYHHHIISYHIISYHIISYHIISSYAISPKQRTFRHIPILVFHIKLLGFQNVKKGSHLHEFDRLCHSGAVTQVLFSLDHGGDRSNYKWELSIPKGQSI